MKALFIFLALSPLFAAAEEDTESSLSFPPAYSTLSKVDQEDWESVTKEFRDNALWNQNTTEIRSCESLYTLPVTTSREGNVSFGGICTIAGSSQRHSYAPTACSAASRYFRNSSVTCRGSRRRYSTIAGAGKPRFSRSPPRPAFG